MDIIRTTGKCKHSKEEVCFDYNNKEENKFDIKKGKAHSFQGIWISMGKPFCEKFQTVDEQWKEKQGFHFCDVKRCKKCKYYAPVEELE